MRKFALLGALLIFFSSNLYADETRSIRTSTETILIGDSEQDLLDKLGKPRPKFFVYGQGRYSCAATEYKYDIDLQTYTVWVCNGKVFKIDVKNK